MALFTKQNLKVKCVLRRLLIPRCVLFFLSVIPYFGILGGIFVSDYKALYRKYRPRDFDDVSGQDAITDILKYQVAENKLSHAYLFCGSRGTGKTSCAKILARAVNCENPRGGNPCCECEACRSIEAGMATDVIEMDAASNNGVGNVRDMKDEIAFTPAFLKYRVYIIDEVHMMSPSAFNALLKTLEEPPPYVIFILATTEFNKLPTTIVSRCQRFDFRRIATAKIVERLMKIASLEGIDLDGGGAAMLARIAEGGMRDAVSLLELCSGAREKIDEALVYRMIGRGNRMTTYDLVGSLLRADYEKIYAAVRDVVSVGSDVGVFWQELIDAYRDVTLMKTSEDAAKYLDLTDAERARLSELAGETTLTKILYHVSVLEGALPDLQRAKETKRAIAEIALVRMCEPKLEVSGEAMLLRIEELERQVSRLKLGVGAYPKQDAKDELGGKSAESAAPVKPETPKMADAAQNTAAPKAVASSDTAALKPYGGWKFVVNGVETAKPSIHSPLARAAVFVKPDGTYLIKVDAFFVRIISSSEENMAIIRGLIAEQAGLAAQSVKIEIAKKETGEAASLADEIENALK